MALALTLAIVATLAFAAGYAYCHHRTAALIDRLAATLEATPGADTAYRATLAREYRRQARWLNARTRVL